MWSIAKVFLCVTILQVNNNGHVSFDDPDSRFDPLRFPLNDSTPLIAPYWADTDTRINGIGDAGTVWYRESIDQADRDRAQREIRRAFPGQAARFTPRLVFIATWDHVGYHEMHVDKVRILKRSKLARHAHIQCFQPTNLYTHSSFIPMNWTHVSAEGETPCWNNLFQP